MHHTCTNITARNELAPYPRLYRVIPLTLWLALCFIAGKAGAQQYTADFTAAPTFIDYPGVPFWKQTAAVTLGGTVYHIVNGGNGGWQHMTSGGNGNSASILYSTAATTSVTIRRQDNGSFTFNGAWLRYTNSTNATFYPPPYLTVSYVGAAPAVPAETYAGNTTITLTKNLTVTAVTFSFSGLLDLYFDNLIVSAAAPTVPTVTTSAINQFSNTTALLGGNVTQDGNATVTERGIVYNTTGTPTIADTKVAMGTGTGTYSQTVTGLTSGVTYYVRAYATNSIGTAYGNAGTFTTAGPFTLAQTHNFNSDWVTTSSQASPFTKYVEGWNVTATATAAGNVSVTRISGTTINSAAEGAASLRATAANTTPDLLSVGLKASTGAAFDLQSFQLRYNTRTAGTSFGTITVTGYKGGVPVAGAVTSLTGLVPSTANVAYTTFDLSGNNNFNDIDEFRITAADSPNAARLLSVDLDMVTVQNPPAAATAPTVTASAASTVTSSSALLGGEVTAAGSTAVTERGIVYNTTGTPTTAHTKVAIGSGTGTFSQAVTGLTANTMYYARAYAINAAGTSYSATTITFTTTKQDQTITFNALPAKTFGDAAFGLTASASSGLAVTYTSSNPAVATVSGSTVTIVGVGTATITATQAGNAQYNAAPAVPQSLLVRAAPVLATIGSKTGNEQAALAFTASATDADTPAGTLTYTLANAATGTHPAGAAITPAGAFSWTPTEAQGPGVYRVKVVVSDGTLTDEEEIEITVGEVNGVPVLAAIGNRSTAQGAPVSFTVSATDADAPANTLAYSLAAPASGTYPAGAVINAATGAFSWTPAASQVGVFRVKLVVTDDGTPARSAEQEVQITVQDTQRPTLLTKNITAALSAGGTVSVVPADIDGGSTDNGGAVTLKFAVYGEVAEGGTLTLTAPAGAVFDRVVFASYGTATGSDGNYATGGCHAADSKTPVENALLGQNAGSISATNGLFGDPCGGTFKKLVVVATYTTAGADRIDYNCTDAGSKAVTLLGLDAAGNYAVAPAAVTVTDAQSPSLTVSADITTVNDEAATGAVVTYTAPTAADNCAGFAITQTAGLASGAVFPAGVTTNTFRVSDAAGNVTAKSFTVTVNTINRAPVLAAIGSKTADENAPLSFTAAAADTDVPANTLSYSLAAPAAGTYPAGASVDAATGAFTWTPTEAQGGAVYRVKVVVTDNGTPALIDEEEIEITVGEVNVAPVLASIGSKTVNERTALAFTASATDVDLPANALSYSLATPATGTFPAGATVDAATGQFAWTPTEAQGAGVYRVKVVVSDGASTDEEEIELTVNEVNAAPVLAAIGAKTVTEGALLSFSASATDIDLPANPLTYSLAGTVPAGASIDAATGAFSWTPTETQRPGSYTFRVVVSDGTLTDEEEITVTVSESNLAPVLASIGNQTVDEGTILSFTASAADADLPANALIFSLSGTVPAGATIDASAGAFAWTPTEAQGPGSYTFRVVVSDGTLTDEEEITVTVSEVNVAPVLASIGSKTVNERMALAFTVSAADADLPTNALTYSLAAPATGTFPAGATIDAATGQFAWTPGELQGPGVYRVKVVVSDGALTDEEEIELTVNEVNQAPVLAAIGSKTVTEGALLAFTASAADADLPANALTFSLSGTVPAGASIDASAGAFSWTPSEAQGPGSYTFRVVVSDGALTDEEEITVTVGEVNVAPVLASIGSKTVDEMTALAFTALATDVDLPTNVLTYALTAPATGVFPAGATIDAATGQFAWTPGELQGPGVYRVKVVVSDGALTDEEEIELTVSEVNEAPVLAAIGSKTVAEGALLAFTAAATDADVPASSVQYSLGGVVPAGAAIDAATGEFTWTPTETQGPHAYTFTVVASDGTRTDEEEITVTVTEVNVAPVLASIGNQAVDEGTMLAFTASATDADRPADAVPVFIPLEATSQLPNVLTFRLSGTVPAGATINASTGEFTWTPTETQGPGSYTFTVIVSDGTRTDEEEITVTVGEVNLAPVLASIGNQAVDEETTLSFTASATDVDLPANPLTYALAGTVPAGASIDASTGAFAWTPTETQGPGSYTFTVVVSDGTLTDEEEITVTVGEVNLAPVLALIGGKTVDEETELAFTASAADADLPARALSYSLAAPASGTYPTGAVITAVGGFSWTPTETQGPGAYRVKVVVSDGTLTDEEEIELTVGEVNSAPAFTSQPVLSVVEDTPYAYPVTAADGDFPTNVLTLAAPGLPAWLTFDPATGVLSGTPENAQVGVHPIVLTVTDGMRTVEQTFALEVRNHNDAPVITAGSTVVNNLTVAEDQPLSVSFEVSDVDSPLSALRVRAASSNADLVPVSAISFAGTGNTRTVRFTPLPDTFGGPLTLTLEVSDGELTASTSFQVTVLPVNDAPAVHPVAEVELRINSPAQALTLTGISAGPANESDQQLALSVQSDNPVMIPAADIVYHGDGTATLRFTPAQSQTLTGPATLTVTIRDNGGRERDGEDTRQLIIPVRFLPTNNAVFMPNLFTPNGDLSNDRFTVMGEGIERITFRIFDKKGTMVYESRDVQEATTRGWDGTYRGETLPAGVYTWQIVGAFLDGSPLHYQGKKAGSVLLSR